VDFASFGESTFSVSESLRATHPERCRGEVLSVALRTSSAEPGAQARLVSSARMLDGTIDTLTLVEG